MGFLAPLFLAGAALIALPLWLHLLRQYRSTPHPFSSLLFFERRVQSSVKHRRLRYRTLLALRIALLLLLALAFANPYINRTVPVTAGRTVHVIAVDDSFSMRYGDHLRAAKDKALDALRAIPNGDRAQVLALDSHAHYLTQLVNDRDQLRNAIQSIRPSDARSSYAELSRALRALSQSEKATVRAVFVTDSQRTSLPPAFADLALADDVSLQVESVASASEPNWTVAGVTAPSRVYDPKRAPVEAVIAGFNTPAARKSVSLTLDGKTLETKSVDVPANGRATVTFASLETPYGFHRGEVRIDSSDQLSGDDRFPFAVERTDPGKVLYLHEPGRDNGLLYFRTALDSVPDVGFTLEALAAADAGNQSLSRYAFVVLADPARLSQSVEDNLRRYVNGGGSLLVILGPNSAASSRVPIADVPIDGVRYTAREGDRFETVASADTHYAPLAGAGKFNGVLFYQTVRTVPGDGARIAARLSGGTPLLYEKRAGEGRVLVFASPLDNVANDLPVHAAFVPFIEQTARYLGGQRERSYNVAVDSYIDLHRAGDRGAAVQVIAPDGSRPLTLSEAATATNFAAAEEGFYEVHRPNGRQELVAVHADRAESDLTPIPAETLSLWTATPAARKQQAPVTPLATSTETRREPLWLYVLLIALAAAIVEALFSVRYLSVENDVKSDAEQKAKSAREAA